MAHVPAAVPSLSQLTYSKKNILVLRNLGEFGDRGGPLEEAVLGGPLSLCLSLSVSLASGRAGETTGCCCSPSLHEQLMLVSDPDLPASGVRRASLSWSSGMRAGGRT